MNTGESNRPSLVAGGGPSIAATGSGRILADMEQRRPERARVPRDGGHVFARRRLLLVLMVVTVLVLLLLSASRLWQGAPADPSRTVPDQGSATQAGPATSLAAPDAAAATPPDVAVIVDDRPGGADPFRQFGVAGAGEVTAGSGARAMSASTSSAISAPAPAAATERRPQAQPAARSARAAAAATAPATADGDGNLLSTLMRIIQQDAAPADGQHESMDALVAQLQADDQRTREAQARLESLGGTQQDAPARRTSRAAQRVEQALAACPKANTPAGIACRDQVCAPHAGKLAACPI